MLGDLRVHFIQAGGQKLDGGAMFGVVPKPLWQRRIPADERNRIQLGMRCLLIEHPSGLILVDTGAGNKENDKFHEIYGVENAGADGRTQLEDGLAHLGVSPNDIGLLISTHLHFDHAGGNTYRDKDGVIRPTFPRARYVVQKRDYEFATHTNERTAPSYFPHNFAAVQSAGLFDFVSGEEELAKGIRVLPTPGHVPGHQSVLVQGGNEIALFMGDLCPTSAHLSLPWIMGYDVEPLVTLEAKRATLGRAMQEEWLIVFEHDWHVECGRIAHDGKSYVLAAEAT
jgi:glyoxylase-like metal-dependent hydrolase (beta-lactamase superfamily II)